MLTKKNPEYDVRRLSGLFFNVGLVISIGLVLMAFEWKTPMATSTVSLSQDNMGIDVIEVPPTVVPPPPKPKVEPVVINEVEDEKIVDDMEFVLDIDTHEDDVIEDVIFDEPDEKEDAGEVFMRVERMPEFMGGGQGKFLQYVGKHLKYPSKARKLGIEGKVFVQFVIGKDGSMQEIQVVRGIGAGCDKEVMRVLNEAPHWTPGKQRGRPVKVQMIVPVTFRLN